MKFKKNDVVVIKKSVYSSLDEGDIGVVKSKIELIKGKGYIVEIDDYWILNFYPREIEKIGEL